jgi:hypothetical protein
MKSPYWIKTRYGGKCDHCKLGIKELRPLAGKPTRTIRLASRPGFPRPQALRALERVIRTAVAPLGPRRGRRA